MAAYPATLPQFPILNGFKDKRQNVTIRSEMETGAPKTRQVMTSAVRTWKWTTILNGTQRATFDTFFITTINNGATSFTIPDPIDGATVTVRFKDPPEWNIVGGDETVAGRQWRATYNLEILP